MTSPRRRTTALLLSGIVLTLSVIGSAPDARADPLPPITGSGSTESHEAFNYWRSDLASSTGNVVNYSGVGDAAGRRDFISGTVDFAVTGIPFQAAPEDGSAPEVPNVTYTYIPITATATSFAYNLRANGSQVTNLRLSSATLAGIFTGTITSWSDPRIVAENPGTALPSEPITPVVRADASASTAQFTQWLLEEQGPAWTSFCSCTSAVSLFPPSDHARAQNGAVGVAGFVSQDYGRGSITYVSSQVAERSGLSVAKVLNRAGYYVAPSADAVSIALLSARLDSTSTFIPSSLSASTDPRAYPVPAYAYLVVPLAANGAFVVEKGASLGSFARYALCAGQAVSAARGFAPLPLNLVQSGFAQVARVPGAGASALDPASCANPTFGAGDTESDNRVLRTAVFPAAADRAETQPAPAASAGSVSVVTSVITSADGPLSLSFPSGRAAAFAAPFRFGGRSMTLGTLPAITVQDERGVTNPGWSLMVQVTDFVNTADAGVTISGAQLGLAPSVTVTSAAAAAGPEQTAGRATYPALFASARAGNGLGASTLGGVVTLAAPADRPAGTYVATMTFTLVSN